jgi:YbbR domain-containing protein
MSGPRNVLIHNWRLKLAALGLSIFLWALVQTEPRTSESFQRVPVQVELTDTLWALAGPTTPTEVELQLSGPSRDIIRLAREGTALSIPISEVGTPDTSVLIDHDWVELGQWTGLTVEVISPAMIEIMFEPTMTRTLPIATRIYGDLRSNLALASSVGVAPVSVQVRGSESRIAQLDSILLERFDLATVEKSGEGRHGGDYRTVIGADSIFWAQKLG